MPGNEFVTIVVGGGEFSGWKSVSYKASATSPERNFQIVGVARSIADGGSPKVKDWLGQDCTILSNGNLVMTGIVEDAEILLDSANHEARITGKSRGAMMVKCSVDHATHELKNVTPLQVMQAVDDPGIGYSSDEQMDKIDRVRMNVGDTHLKVLDKLARKQGLFICSKRDGGVNITRHGKKRHAGGLVEGINFKGGTARFSISNRFEKVKVKGHRHKGTGKASFRYQSEYNDPQARKGTIKVIVPRTDMTREEAKKHAEHLAETRFGDSTQLNGQAQGWRDESGELWEVGYLVWCEVPNADIEMDLCINELNMTQNETETVTQMTLVHPSALGGKTAGKSAKYTKGKGFTWRGGQENK